MPSIALPHDKSPVIVWCRIVAIASSPQGLQFTCSAIGRLLTTNPTGELNAPRVGKLSVWDLRTMKPEVWSQLEI